MIGTSAARDRRGAARSIAALAACGVVLAASGVANTKPTMPAHSGKGHKLSHSQTSPRNDKPRRLHKWRRYFFETSLRDTGWICVKAYRDRRGFWHCTAWAMR